MAMFKVYWGEKKDLPKTYHAGYAYFTTDDGMLYIDTTDEAEGRVEINAKGATGLIRDGQFIDADQFVDVDDVIDVEHGGTGKESVTKDSLLVGDGINPLKELAVPAGSMVAGDQTAGLKALTAEEVRTLLNLYTKEETENKIKDATTVAYEATLTVEGWSEDGEEYSQTYEQSQLQCGAYGDVPPIVTYRDNLEEYSKIDRAEATAKSGVKFYIKEPPKNAINIIVIDQK